MYRDLSSSTSGDWSRFGEAIPAAIDFWYGGVVATILKNILSFTGLVVGVPMVLPHRLNVNGISVLPRTVEPDVGGFTIAADVTNVTVTRAADGPANVNVLVEYWHSIEAVVPLVPPPGKLVGQVPWIQQPGSGGGGSGTTYAFVFQPGGTPGANVFDDWMLLNTAMAAVRGPKLLQFDDQFSAISIPAGTWDMTDTVWEGIDKNYSSSLGSTLVTFDDGAVVTKLRTVRGLRLDALGAPPITDLTDGDVFILDDYTVIGGFNNPVIDLSSIDVFKSATLSVRHGSQVLQQGFPITGLTNGQLIIEVDKASLVEANTVDNGFAGGGALLIRQQAGDSFAGLQSFFGGGVQVVNSLGGFNMQPNSGLQLNAGIVNYFVGGGAENANLMPASWHPGGIFVVKHAATTGTVTINPSGADTIDGNPTHVLNPGGSVIMVSDGISNYMIIGEKI